MPQNENKRIYSCIVISLLLKSNFVTETRFAIRRKKPDKGKNESSLLFY